MQRRRPGTTIALVLFTLVASSGRARADGPASGGTASYGARAGKGNARVTVAARGKTVAITAFAWTAASGIATWKLVTIDNGEVVKGQVFQKSSGQPLSEDEATTIRQRRIALSKCDLYYCPPSAEDEKVWTNQSKRYWLPAAGKIDTPRDLVTGNKQRLTTLPVLAPFSVSEVARVPEPGHWVTKTEPRRENYWTTEPIIVTITSETNDGYVDKNGNEHWNGWKYAGTRTENRGSRTVEKTRTVYVDKQVWEPLPERLWVRATNANPVASPPPPPPPDPDRLITVEAEYNETTGLTTAVVVLDASVTYARAYATIPGKDAGPAQVAGTTASASPEGTHTESAAGPETADEPPKAPSPQRTSQPRRRGLFGR